MYIVLKKEGNKTMKKFAISLLVLALAFGVAANAAIGVRSDLAGNATGVLGLNNIDVLFGYTSLAGSTGNINGGKLVIGATYYFAKLGEVKVGVNGTYGQTTVRSAYPTGSSNTSSTAISLGLDVNAELAKGLSVGVLANVFNSNTPATGTATAGTAATDFGVFLTSAVYVQALAF